MILGILVDKDVESMIKVICPRADKIIAVAPHSNRAESSQNLMNRIAEVNENVEAVEGYEEAFIRGRKYSTEKDIIVICGSLYMIGDMRGIIKESLKNNN